MPDILHGKKLSTCSQLMKPLLNNVVLSNLFIPINNIEQYTVEPESAVRMRENIADNNEQSLHQNMQCLNKFCALVLHARSATGHLFAIVLFVFFYCYWN